MSGLGLFATLIVGGLAGWIAGKIMDRERSLLMNIVLGVLGAMLFNAILRVLFGSTLGGLIGQLFVGVVGACIVIALVNVLRSRS